MCSCFCLVGEISKCNISFDRPLTVGPHKMPTLTLHRQRLLFSDSCMVAKWEFLMPLFVTILLDHFFLLDQKGKCMFNESKNANQSCIHFIFRDLLVHDKQKKEHIHSFLPCFLHREKRKKWRSTLLHF